MTSLIPQEIAQLIHSNPEVDVEIVEYETKAFAFVPCLQAEKEILKICQKNF